MSTSHAGGKMALCVPHSEGNSSCLWLKVIQKVAKYNRNTSPVLYVATLCLLLTSSTFSISPKGPLQWKRELQIVFLPHSRPLVPQSAYNHLNITFLVLVLKFSILKNKSFSVHCNFCAHLPRLCWAFFFCALLQRQCTTGQRNSLYFSTMPAYCAS